MVVQLLRFSAGDCVTNDIRNQPRPSGIIGGENRFSQAGKHSSWVLFDPCLDTSLQLRHLRAEAPNPFIATCSLLRQHFATSAQFVLHAALLRERNKEPLLWIQFPSDLAPA